MKKGQNTGGELVQLCSKYELEDRTFETRILLPRYVEIRAVYEKLILGGSCVSVWAVGGREVGRKVSLFSRALRIGRRELLK